MKVCFYGAYNRNYNRNLVILDGLKQNGVTILERNCHENFLIRSPKLFFKTIFSDFDVLFVAYPGIIDTIPAKLICLLKRKPLVFDVFVSGFESNVEYGITTKNSLYGKFLWFLDKLSCSLADIICLDTQEQVNYFVNEFKLPEQKFFVFPVGASESIIKPSNKKVHNKFRVFFYGHVTPLQGFNFVVEAAKKLKNHKDVEFIFLGDNRYYQKEKASYPFKNVIFLEPKPYSELLKVLYSSNITLAGHFGATAKSSKVIPNKVFEGLASKTVTVIGDYPLNRRFFSNKQVVFAKTHNSDSIANAILFVKNNPVKAKKIAVDGFNLFKKNFSSKIIGNQIKTKLQELVK